MRQSRSSHSSARSSAVAKAGTAPTTSRRVKLLGKHPIGIPFVAPYVAFLIVVFAYPLGLALYMSFHDYFFAAPGAIVERPFIGVDNYTQVLGDPVFRTALFNVAKFVIINVPLTVALALVLATALNRAIPWRTFFRASYYVPYVTASVAVVGIWLWLFAGNGLVNTILGPLAPDPPWLVNEAWALPVIALLVTWKQLGFYVLLYLAAMQNVPNELYEAAKVDGAGAIRSFFAVTVPGVRAATTLVVILATIVGANFFTEPYLLTGGGGPNNSSISPVLMMYREGIEQGNAGYAAAIGVILAIGVLAISLLNRYVLERD
ncbi:MAG: sugar ABC transporter permease [Actinobacteria bacterium]|nr:sugar ABC transporter permease [Actinomycetota bacterium]